MCSIVPIKFLSHTEFHDKKLRRGSKEDGVMLRKGLANSDVEEDREFPLPSLLHPLPPFPPLLLPPLPPLLPGRGGGEGEGGKGGGEAKREDEGRRG